MSFVIITLFMCLGDKCMVDHIQFDGTIAQCALFAEIPIAKYMENYPGYIVKKYRCSTDVGA